MVVIDLDRRRRRIGTTYYHYHSFDPITEVYDLLLLEDTVISVNSAYYLWVGECEVRTDIPDHTHDNLDKIGRMEASTGSIPHIEFSFGV